MKVIPALTEEGWISDSNTILSYIVSYYILTDAMQSICYQGNLVSLPETYFEFINDPDSMSTNMKSDVESLLSGYFDNYEVQVSVKEMNDKSYSILLYAAAIDEEGKKIELSKVVEMETAGVRKIIQINNYGDGLSYLDSL